MKSERYKPVPLDVDAAHKRWMKRPGYAVAYAALVDEFATLAELLRARQHAGMTQADVAERMGIAQASVARPESSAGSRKHAHRLRRFVATPMRLAVTFESLFHSKLHPSVPVRAQVPPTDLPGPSLYGPA